MCTLQAPHQVVAEFSLGSYNEEKSDMDMVHDDGSAGGISSKYVSQVGACDGVWIRQERVS